MKHNLLLLILSINIFAETMREDFNSLNELKQNWWISRWGQEQKQYDTSMVDVKDSILILTMRPDSLNGKPRPLCGEVTYTSRKFLYGSFRASIKTTSKRGGVVGWFVYKDGVPGDGNLHEIDVEFLTEDLSQVQYTLHHDAYGVDHTVDQIDFDPSADFHEYRFDWYRDSVVYFIDGVRRTKLTNKVPDDSCSIMLNYWSNNDNNWGGPMPDTITHMYVDYVEYVSFDETAIKNKGIKNNTISFTNQKLFINDLGEDINKITIADISGKLLLSKSIRNNEVIDLASLSNGLLFVTINGNKVYHSFKIVNK